MESGKPLQINLREVLTHKFGAKIKYVPGFAMWIMERLIRQNELNACLRLYSDRRGVAFCRGVLEYFHICAKIEHRDWLPMESRCVFVCNHPLGGMDGISLMALLGGHYRREPLVLVNDFLMAVEPLKANFLPVNKFGRQNKSVSSKIDEAFSGDAPIIIFPAGLVSRRQNGSISDLAWNKSFIKKAIASKRDVVPLYFSGLNSKSFYIIAWLRKLLGIKFNYEMILLPGELVKSHGKKYTVTPGEPIPWQTLETGSDTAMAQHIREIVYKIPELQHK